jgi:hypothetical protein
MDRVYKPSDYEYSLYLQAQTFNINGSNIWYAWNMKQTEFPFMWFQLPECLFLARLIFLEDGNFASDVGYTTLYLQKMTNFITTESEFLKKKKYSMV